MHANVPLAGRVLRSPPLPALGASAGLRKLATARTERCQILRSSPVYRPSAVQSLRLAGSKAARSPHRHAVVASMSASSSGGLEGTIDREAKSLRRIGWISFWSQLALSIVSATVLFFTITSSLRGRAPPISAYCTLFGVATSFISTFLSYSYAKLAKKVEEGGAEVKKQSVEGTLLNNVRLNLWGTGSTLLGLQATVGTLVGKTLSSSSTNPYQAAQAGQAAAAVAPAALDVFSIQASTNTLLAHFVSIVFANWLLRTLQSKSMKGSTLTPPKPVEPDYTQRSRGKGPSGSLY